MPNRKHLEGHILPRGLSKDKERRKGKVPACKGGHEGTSATDYRSYR